MLLKWENRLYSQLQPDVDDNSLPPPTGPDGATTKIQWWNDVKDQIFKNWKQCLFHCYMYMRENLNSANSKSTPLLIQTFLEHVNV